MITEIAAITIDPAKAAEFEQAVAKAAPLFQASKGCLGMRLERIIERPEQYHLIVHWETLEAHTEGFRGSEAFQGWRALAGPFFVAPLEVVHSRAVASFF